MMKFFEKQRDRWKLQQEVERDYCEHLKKWVWLQGFMLCISLLEAQELRTMIRIMIKHELITMDEAYRL